MTLKLELSPAQEQELEMLAQSEGMPVAEYALRKLLPDPSTRLTNKPYRALQFSGITPTSRTADEINADIDSARREWDEREQSYRVATVTPSALG